MGRRSRPPGEWAEPPARGDVGGTLGEDLGGERGGSGWGKGRGSPGMEGWPRRRGGSAANPARELLEAPAAASHFTGAGARAGRGANKE